MSDKIERYNDIAIELAKFAPVFAKGDDHDAELEAAKTIRELRQAIERLRRIVDDGEPNEDKEDARIYRMVDVWKLPKDALVKVVWEFLRWQGDYETGCPAKVCKDYPCSFKKNLKQELDENLANGDLDKKTYDKHLNNMDFDDCGDGEGCWGSYYVWCYLNGYNSLNGKKEEK